jgi:precorrin isomerase
MKKIKKSILIKEAHLLLDKIEINIRKIVCDIKAKKAGLKEAQFSEFDKLLSSLEEDEEMAEKLNEARKWVVKEFY